MILSIIIPVYNQQGLIVRCINSIPVRDDIEIIVVDDGSTDRTAEVVQKLPDPRIKLFQLMSNKGVGAAKNIGLEICIGDYVGFIDSDDYVYTAQYNQIIDMLGEYDIYYMNLRYRLGRFYLTEESKHALCGNPCKIIRRSLIGDTQFREDIRAAEDYFFNEEIQAKPHTDYFTNIFAYFYDHPRSGSLTDQVRKGLI